MNVSSQLQEGGSEPGGADGEADGDADGAAEAGDGAQVADHADEGGGRPQAEGGDAEEDRVRKELRGENAMANLELNTNFYMVRIIAKRIKSRSSSAEHDAGVDDADGDARGPQHAAARGEQQDGHADDDAHLAGKALHDHSH